MKYIKVGTIGYIKDQELKIRQVRCVDYVIDGTTLYPVKWEIAGSGKTFYTDQDGRLSNLNFAVFMTANDAYDYNEHIQTNAEFDEEELALEFYPTAKLFSHYSSHTVNAKCFNVRDDMFIEQVGVYDVFRFHITKDGVTPKLYKVDSGEYFLTYEEAAASRPKPEIITFDESEPAEVDTTCEISNGSSKQPRMDIKTDESKAVFLCIGTSIIDWANNNPFVEPLVTLDDFEENGFSKEDFERSQKLAVGEKWQTDFPEEGVFIMRVQ